MCRELCDGLICLVPCPICGRGLCFDIPEPDNGCAPAAISLGGELLCVECAIALEGDGLELDPPILVGVGA